MMAQNYGTRYTRSQRKRQPSQTLPNKAWDEKHIVRRLMGLTQVCREIRNEFLPMYRFHHARTHVTVPINDLYSYLEDILGFGTIKDEEVVGDVRVILPFWPAIVCNVNLDLTRIMRLSASAAQLQIRFEPHAPTSPEEDCAKLLNMLLHIDRGTVLLDPRASAALRITLQGDKYGELWVSMHINEKYWQAWMTNYHRLVNDIGLFKFHDFQGICQRGMHWTRAVGLPLRSGWDESAALRMKFIKVIEEAENESEQEPEESEYSSEVESEVGSELGFDEDAGGMSEEEVGEDPVEGSEDEFEDEPEDGSVEEVEDEYEEEVEETFEEFLAEDFDGETEEAFDEEMDEELGEEPEDGFEDELEERSEEDIEEDSDGE